MSEIVPPSVNEFQHRKDEGYTDEEALRLATDLFFRATNLKAYPTIPSEVRLVNEAIYHMAWFLQERHEDQEAMFSPFSSERIGSYSYSKMAKAVAEGSETGVNWFDWAVAYFLNQQSHDGGLFDTTSEDVFARGFAEHYEDLPSRSGYRGWSHEDPARWRR